MRDKPLRSSDIKSHNTNMILSLIHAYRSEGVSQSELVESTGLKAPTLFRIFSALQEEGLIKPMDGVSADSERMFERKKGRRPLVYTINPTARYILSAEFWATCISMGLFDFAGNQVAQTVKTLPQKVGIEHVEGFIAEMAENLIARHKIPRDRLLGLAVAAPGQVDVVRQRVVFYSWIAGMRDYPLAEKLEARVGMSVLLHNNCSALALGEYTYGGFGNKESMFVFLLRTGVNGAFVKDGKIFTNTDGITLEAGHMPINFDGPQCSCGSRECLQGYLLNLGGCKDAREPLFSNLEQPLADGDPFALETIRTAARYLYISMKSIAGFLAPRSFLIVSYSQTVSEAIAKAIANFQRSERLTFNRPADCVYADTYRSIRTQQGMVDLLVQRSFS